MEEEDDGGEGQHVSVSGMRVPVGHMLSRRHAIARCLCERPTVLTAARAAWSWKAGTGMNMRVCSVSLPWHHTGNKQQTLTAANEKSLRATSNTSTSYQCQYRQQQRPHRFIASVSIFLPTRRGANCTNIALMMRKRSNSLATLHSFTIITTAWHTVSSISIVDFLNTRRTNIFTSPARISILVAMPIILFIVLFSAIACGMLSSAD